jgi:TatD DNase family protein
LTSIDAGVEKIVVPGAKIDSSKKAIEIASEFASCYATVGIHPHHAKEYVDNEELMSQLIDLIKNENTVAVGEIGLDYHQYQGYPLPDSKIKTLQKDLLLIQMKLATDYHKPIIFHCREAFFDLINIIKKTIQTNPVQGVFHCFSGEKNDLQTILDLGFYVGFDGNITYPENERLRTLVNITPIEKMLLETDSPFLTPVPFRNSRNEPANIKIAASCISSIKNLPYETIASQTSLNVKKLFNLN